MRLFASLPLWLAFFVLASCTSTCGGSRSKLSPDQVVENYLNISLNMSKVEQKAALLELTTGNLKNAIVEASDDDIMNGFIKKNYHLKSYSVVERRNRTPREVEITFRIEYQELGQNPQSSADAPVVTTDNTVAVIKEKGSWYIRDVLGKKTSIDFPVAPEGTIKPDPKGTPDSEPVEPETIPLNQ